MSQGPRVRRLILFKHGVAYLERGGPADGAFELSFKRDEMNDVLKSLAVWVASGKARVGAVAFEAPEDPEAALAERKLLFEPGAALRGLLHSLRGRRIAVATADRRHEGEVVGLEESEGGGETPTRRALLLRGKAGALELVDLAHARAVELLEEPSRADLEMIVDRGRAATTGESRTVKIALDGRADDLRVAYVIPAPVWRVSYRIARDGEKTLLVAWGIVFNPADEDLAEVDLTLTTGQPVSFVIDLYHPMRVQRAVVEEQARVAAPPTRFERAARKKARAVKADSADDETPGADPFGTAAFAAGLPVGGGPPGAAAAPFLQAASFADSAAGAAEGAERGELFEYRVSSPVSIKRGGSAMVPLTASNIDGKKERIWRDGSPPAPDLVLTFQNDTGVVLEEGPATLYDEGAYAGEAMVPYSARGTEVKLAYAKDLAVRCRRSSQVKQVIAGLSLAKDFVFEDRRLEERHELTAESDHDEPVDVIFELARNDTKTVDASGAKPFEETASFRRFKASVPPHGKTSVVVVERWPQASYVRYQDLAQPQLASWLAGRFLDQATHDGLAGVLAAWAEAAALDQKRARLERERQEAFEKQEKIVQQLSVLKDSGAEGGLRLRYAKELEAEQNKVNACEEEIAKLRARAAKRRASAREELKRLANVKDEPGAADESGDDETKT